MGSLPARVADARRKGLAALTLARGLPADGAPEMPWLLAGAKTLSYAVNMAALRHAERHNAGDVIFVSSDGYILEGPRSTVVIATELDGNPALLTPPPWYPILRGTTQQALFEVARNKGYDCDYGALRPADLVASQGVWLVSSITLAAWELDHINLHTGVSKQASPRGAHKVCVAVQLDTPAEIDRLYGELVAKGVPFYAPPGDYAWNARCAYFTDPDDTLWELYAWLDGGPGDYHDEQP